eukprot:5497403-Amphidinium_carterae.6
MKEVAALMKYLKIKAEKPEVCAARTANKLRAQWHPWHCESDSRGRDSDKGGTQNVCRAVRAPTTISCDSCEVLDGETTVSFLQRSLVNRCRSRRLGTGSCVTQWQRRGEHCATSHRKAVLQASEGRVKRLAAKLLMMIAG